ncbi:uncharacterized protein GGS22DRAFT_200009 [Annulohypoxylon maeteangense]|uniref:uncharacterized protein n=1 Tax=Annulohypoxylon maeteangense TaxID=1927788 RepID=UPI002008E07F|nr:uncharacterized protein GGS22DRAFT_200009 [Annulohypoxylon maeteangense]KAI0885848.1 hypothetical protein GGS22DRAFT_200009 [Annulohypoxylon maeteangense]
MAFVWHCCHCKWEGYGAMSTTLYPACLSCQQERCGYCDVHSVSDERAEGMGTLYSRPEADGVITEREALRGLETSHPFTERASQLQAKNMAVDQIPSRYSAATNSEPVPLVYYSHNNTGSISGVESEISRPSLLYADRECTPHSSCPDTTDPSDSPSTIDKDEKSAGILFGESCLNPTSSIAPQYYYFPELGDAEGNGIDPIDPELEMEIAGADAIEPLRHQWDIPDFPIHVDPLNIAYYPDSSQLRTPWTNDIIQHLSTPCPMPSMADQCKTSSSPAPFSPGTSLHQSTDQQHITKKGKPTQISKSCKFCESCLSREKLNGKSKYLACLFYKLNPEQHIKCISKEFSTIGHLRQHLDKHHKLEKYYCNRCWVSFKDEGSLKAHPECQPMGGVPVNDLAPISKTRDMKADKKWYLIWKQLFGESTPSPECPYSHPIQDFKSYNFDNLHRNLEMRGSVFSLAEIKQVSSKLRTQSMARNQLISDG